jgi:hypothetical protein
VVSGAQDTTNYGANDDEKKDGHAELDPRTETFLLGWGRIVSRLIVVWIT